MSSLATLTQYVDAQNAPLDWPAFLNGVASEFRATVCLFYHEFGTAQRGAMLETVGMAEEYIEKYKLLSIHNPWLSFLLSRPTGFFIVGGEVNPLERSRSDPLFEPFYTHWMVPQNVIRGIGAVLSKDKTFFPDWAVAIALLRPDGEPGIGRYSAEEVERFQPLIPFMLRHIRNHPFVENRIIEDNNVTFRYIAPDNAGDDVPKQDEIGDFLTRMAITAEHRREVAAEVIEAARHGDDALLNAVRRTLKTHRAGHSAPPLAQVVPPPPDKPPALYADRPIDPKTGRQEGVDKFFPRAYAPWIVDGVFMLPRKLIEQLDLDCDRALTAWPNNHKGQEFPVQIARKGAAVPPLPEQVQEVWRETSWAERQKRKQGQKGAGRAGHL